MSNSPQILFPPKPLRHREIIEWNRSNATATSIDRRRSEILCLSTILPFVHRSRRGVGRGAGRARGGEARRPAFKIFHSSQLQWTPLQIRNRGRKLRVRQGLAAWVKLASATKGITLQHSSAGRHTNVHSFSVSPT